MAAAVDPLNAAPALIRAEDVPGWRRVVALSFMCFAYGFYAWSWNTVDILRPYIADALSLTLPQAGSLYSAQSLGALVGAVINGQLADKFGRRRALMAATAGFGLCLALGALAQDYWQVLLQRAVMGFFMGSMFPITAGLYSTFFPPQVRGRIASIVFATYNAAVAALGAASAALFAAGLDWRLLLWTGLIPLAAAIFAPAFVPNDRHVLAWGDVRGPERKSASLPIAELFTPQYRKQTLLLTLMTGLNFFAYQAFTGWATTYLADVRQLSGEAVGTIISWQFIGGIAGTFFWGWVGDTFGRRRAAFGFLIGAALILAFLFAPIGVGALTVVACLYGAAASSSVIWGPWLTELYPAHLKSTAASIFNWGRVISFMAPLVTGFIAESAGLGATMSIASATFIAAALVWLSLPETLKREATTPREGAR